MSSDRAPQPQAGRGTLSPIDVELNRIGDLAARGRHGEAVAAAEMLAAAAPSNREALYLIAANQRYLHQIPQALETLVRLEQRHPRFSRLYQERGYCHLELRDASRAIDALRRAVILNPALASSWSMLEQLYRITGDAQNAAASAEHVLTLKRLPSEIVQAGSLFSDGDLAPAENILRNFLRRSGEHVEALRLLARIGHRRNALDDAESLFEAALGIAPDYRAARADYARVLIDRQKYREARGEIARLLHLEPDNHDYLSLHAAVYAGLGDHDRAIALYRKLLAATPGWAHLHVALGHSWRAAGQSQQAIDSYRAAVAARPSFGDAYWGLANLKTYRFSPKEIACMRTEEAAPAVPSVDRCPLCFALGKAFEDAGEYAESWRYYERGNLLKQAESSYRPETTEINTRLQIEVCTREFFSSREGVGVPDPDPIFIVGLPRSGSTLLEQILASHSQVEGTQELYDIPRLVLELQGRSPDATQPRYPRILTDLAPEELSTLGERYLTGARAFRGAKPFFTDKMPNNFRHIGLIHLMMPNAKIIDVRREPMGCCMGNLKQLFASGQEFSYGIENIARYYRTYLELMRHWDEVLPGRVLRMQYEDIVDDLEGSVRCLLRYCGLEFERACVEFHRSGRSVRTASSEQVRRPLYRDGLRQWKNYEPWLGPLEDALGDALTRYRD